MAEKVAAALAAGACDVEVVGGGTPYLAPVTADVSLELTETRTFDSRVIYERFGRSAQPRRWAS